MPKYAYEAMNSVGQPVRSEVDAATSEEAIAKVRAMGYFPTKIKETAAKKKVKGGPAPEIGAGRRRSVSGVKRKHLTQFTRQLSTLIDAGLPIVRSLRILEQQQKPGPLRMAIRMVADDVEAGTTLSEAMERSPKVFDNLYTSMVRAGELGGVLDVILVRLADFMEKAEALRRKVVSAMIYPLTVICFAIIIVTGLLKLVVPKFVDVFSNMHADMPGPTLFLMATSSWIEAGGWIVVLGAPFGLWGLIKLLNRTKAGKEFIDSLKLRIPVVGQIVAKGTVSRFARTLGTLLEAGVPILEAIHITRNTCGNAVYAGAMEKVYEGIREGENFADPLRRSKVVDPMVINMIDVGEETGELDKMLVKIADTYDDEVQTLVASMTALMEPLMVVVLGGIVGFIVVSLFLPMVALLRNLKSQ
ncbi:MAG: type II secretion system F family protein [Planctomycetota bacterium]|nr:type II secretion system F family protein [Planctomycetota bacterium]